MGEEIRRLREDAGLSRRRLAEASGVDPTYLRRVEDGLARATTETYAKVSVALGADLSTRLYPNTGPSIRDRHQARILEALLELLHPRWRPFLEVAVRRPARGWIDAVLHEPAQSLVVATEIQSDLRRIEQRLRWFSERLPRCLRGTDTTGWATLLRRHSSSWSEQRWRRGASGRNSGASWPPRIRRIQRMPWRR
jgi:transcriptional regulator with XRE-family HTH domain